MGQLIILCSSTDVIVNTSKGKIRGYVGGAKHFRANVFKGIPFAKPSTGKDRFLKPKNIEEPWEGILNATQYQAACMSATNYTSSPQQNVSEDCLYLNVFADPKCTIRKCAVIVYIHGGSFFFQSAVMFNESVIAEKYASHRIVFVIPAYRLGLFGFISVADEKAAAKNLAFYDIIAALEWVQSEISKFGGDPRRVTLMGHSGGATAVQLLSLSDTVPESLFHQGISLSSADLYRKNLSNAMTMEISYRIGCAKRGEPYDSEAVVECLRQKTATELLNHQKALTDAEYSDLMFGPEPDGLLFKCNIAACLPRRNQRRLLLGITKNELALTRIFSTPKRECDTFGGVYGYHTRQTLDDCVNHYSFENGVILVMRDETRASIFRMASTLSLNKASIFLYSFEMPKHDSHSGDLMFIMGTHRQQQMNTDEQTMDQIFPSYIRQFVKSAQPIGNWEPFEASRGNFMRITHETLQNGTIIEPEMMEGFYRDEVQLWSKHFGEVEQNALAAKEMPQNLSQDFRALDQSDSSTKIGFGISAIKWKSAIWIVFAFCCLFIPLFILMATLCVINNGFRRFIQTKPQNRLPDERTRMLTAWNGKRYILDDDNEQLIF